MKYEAKIIETAINKIEQDVVEKNAPPLDSNINEPSICECPKSFSYRDLKKVSREIVLLRADNFNSLFIEQGSKNFPKIAEVNFIEFYFGQNALVGTFEAHFEDKESFPYKTTISASWNGNKLKVF